MSLAFQKRKVNDDEDPSAFSWYYHDAAAGKYHAIKHLGPGKWAAWMDLDRSNGLPRSWTGARSKAAALAVLHHLAPAAVELPGLPAWLR